MRRKPRASIEAASLRAPCLGPRLALTHAGEPGDRQVSEQRGERGIDACALWLGDEPPQHLCEARHLQTAGDVLVTVRLEERSTYRLTLTILDRASDESDEVFGIRARLSLKDAVDGA